MKPKTKRLLALWLVLRTMQDSVERAIEEAHRTKAGYVRHDYHSRRKEIRVQMEAQGLPYCVGCGSTDDLTLDHLLPLSKGGGNNLGNLQWMCERCNSEKADSLEWYYQEVKTQPS